MNTMRILAIYSSMVLGLRIVIPLIMDYLGINIRFFDLIILLPTVSAGAYLFLRPSSIKIPASLICVIILMAASLSWVFPSERGRGLLILAEFLLPVFVANTINESKPREDFINFFILSSLFVVVISIYNYFLINKLFGHLASPVTGRTLVNRNDTAFFLVFCSLLCMYKLKRDHMCWMLQTGLWSLVITYTICIICGQSRAAFLLQIFFICCGLLTDLVYRGKKNALFIFLLSILLFPLIICSFKELEVTKRFLKDETVHSLGNRTDIWKTLSNINDDSCSTLIYGAGIGGSEILLGKYSEPNVTVLRDDGLRMKNAHSNYIEFLLYVGIIGIPPAILFIFFAINKAWQYDRKEQVFFRTSIVGFLIFSGITIVTWRQPFGPAVTGILFAELFSSHKQ